MPRVHTCYISCLIPLFFFLASLRSPTQNLNLIAGRLFPASQSDTGVSLTLSGDFNGDGKPDLITSTSGSHDLSFSILLGNGDGTFRPPTTIASGAQLCGGIIQAGTSTETESSISFVRKAPATPLLSSSATVTERSKRPGIPHSLVNGRWPWWWGILMATGKMMLP